MGIAALPMYDWPALRGRTDQLWQGLAEELAARGIAAPRTLTRGPALHAIWTAPDLLLAQTCGYPYVRHLKGRVKLVATPCYDVPGCSGMDYSSVLVVRADADIAALADLGEAVAAINDIASFSGHWALRDALAKAGLADRIAAVRVTGAHRASLFAVAEGTADIAAIDCVAWAIAGQHLPEVTGRLRIVGRTDPAPGTPLITGSATGQADLAAIGEALSAVATRADLAQVRADLMIEGFAVPDEAAYDRILEVEAAALADPAWPEVSARAGV